MASLFAPNNISPQNHRFIVDCASPGLSGSVIKANNGEIPLQKGQKGRNINREPYLRRSWKYKITLPHFFSVLSLTLELFQMKIR